MFITKYLRYYGLWVLFFIFTHILFLIYHFARLEGQGALSFFKVLAYGLRMDLSAAAYFSVIPFFIFFVSEWLGGQKWLLWLLKVYTYLFLFLSSCLVIADLELYANWGYRIDDSFLKYLLSPTEMTATVSSYPIFSLVSIFLVLFLANIYLFNRGIFNYLKEFWQKNTQKRHLKTIIWQSVAGFLLVPFLIVPIRGGLQLAPINQASVYFSNNVFLNHAAVNALWNFFVSTFENASDTSNPFNYYAINDAKQTLTALKDTSETVHYLIDKKIKRPNILIVTYESLTAKLIERLGSEKGLTPQFDRLCKEGVLFSEIYASGDRTDRGLVAVLSGYPAIPKANILMTPRKSAQIPILSKTFKDSNYTTGFYYGGEVEFANMKAHLLNGQFTKLVTIHDFKKEELNSKWGAFDHIVFDRLLEDLNTVQEPFFVNLLTLSSHEPFEVPAGWFKEEKKYADDIDGQFKRVHLYSDDALGKFIDKAKQTKWWANTLVIVIADHSSPHIQPHHDWFKRFHIPMLWLGGALSVRDTTINTVASQIDLAATVLHQLDFSANEYTFSRNIFSAQYQPLAHYAFQNGFGLIKSHCRYIYDTNGNFVAQSKGNVDSNDIKQGKAILQAIYDDYLYK